MNRDEERQFEQLRRINEVIIENPQWRFGFTHFEVVEALVASGNDQVFRDNLENFECSNEDEISDDYYDDVLDLLMSLAAIPANPDPTLAPEEITAPNAESTKNPIIEVFVGKGHKMTFKPTKDGWALLEEKIKESQK